MIFLRKGRKNVVLQKISGEFAVCKVSGYPPNVLDADYCFIGRTDGEKSLVCRAEDVPAEGVLARDDGWMAFRAAGTLDFSLIGILAGIAGVLAKEKISLFAVSTYDTDYILVKKERADAAFAALEKAGYTVVDA